MVRSSGEKTGMVIKEEYSDGVLGIEDNKAFTFKVDAFFVWWK
jgi:hypothetical protein